MPISVVVSTQFDQLITELGECLNAGGGNSSTSLIERWQRKTPVVVPSMEMGNALRFGLARSQGVATNLETLTLEKFFRQHIEDACGDEFRLLNKEAIKTLLVDELRDADNLPGPCVEYLEKAGDGGGIRARERSRYQLASTLATKFEEYVYTRRDVLADWRGGELSDEATELDRWQAALWRRVVERARDIDGVAYYQLDVAFERAREELVETLRSNYGDTLRLFGFAGLGHTYVDILESLARDIDVELYFIAPASDLEERSDVHRGLELWGEVGRETLGELPAEPGWLSGAGDGDTDSILDKVQASIGGSANFDDSDSPDDSFRIVDAPGIRREVEIAANDIWRRVINETGDSTEDSLKFSDIAIVVPRSEASEYAAHIEAAFQSFEELPYNFNGIEIGTKSPVLDAIELLLDVPLGEFRRPQVLSLLTHPNFEGQFRDVDAQDWIDWAERLNIFYGADREHQSRRGSYLKSDIFNWEQGMRRLALGAMLDIDDATDADPFEVGDATYLPEPTSLGSMNSMATLHAAVGSLIEDARWLVGGVGEDPPKRKLEEWGKIMASMVETYLGAATTDDAEEEREHKLLAMATGILEDLGDGPEIEPVTYEMARMYAADRLQQLAFETGAFLLDGVIVSTPERLRSIPFQHLYLLGAAEGTFPARDPESELDIRLQKERGRPGDMWPSKRDKYHFLELLQSAGESLTLSWVGRDSTTGDSLPASSVVKDLASMAPVAVSSNADGTDNTKFDELTVEHPLRRYNAEFYDIVDLTESDGDDRADGEDKDEDAPEIPYHQNLHAEAFEEARMVALRESGVIEAADSHGGSSVWSGSAFVDVQNWLHEESGQKSFAPRLQMLSPPGSGDSDEEESKRSISISTSKLRSFLMTPLQTSAKVRSRIYEDEDDVVTRERESFGYGNIERSSIFRESFARAIKRANQGEGDAFEDAIESAVKNNDKGPDDTALPEIIRAVCDDNFRPDDLPRDVFADAAVEGLSENLMNCVYNYLTWGLEKYSIDTSETPMQYAWGKTRGYKRRDCLECRELPGVTLEDIELDGELVDVEISGTSLLLFPEQAAMVRPVRRKVKLASKSPECLVNYVLLVATDETWRRACRKVESTPKAVLSPGKKKLKSSNKKPLARGEVTFPSELSQSKAIEQLREWVQDLLSEPKLLPSDIAADDWEDGRLTQKSAWQFVYDKAAPDKEHGGVQTEYGPVEDFLNYLPPENPRQVLMRRFQYHGSLPEFAANNEEQ